MEKFIHTEILSIEEDDENLHDIGVPVEETWIPYSFKINDIESFYPCIREGEGTIGTVINTIQGGVMTTSLKYQDLIKIVDKEVNSHKWLTYIN